MGAEDTVLVRAPRVTSPVRAFQPTPLRLAPITVALVAVLAAGTWAFRDDLSRAVGWSAAPDYYLWAWRREEDLSFIDTDRVKVAAWTATITLLDEGFAVEHRTNKITYPSDAEIVAVVRIEADGVADDAMVAQLADAIISANRPFRPVEHQIDFDARVSQRDFYRRLLEHVRTGIGDAALSITALASWCFHDDWVETLAVDAVVPMIYRMGRSGDAIRAALFAERAFPAPVCAGNIGYSADEPLAPLDGLRRVFLFHPEPWTVTRFDDLLSRLDALP